MKYTVNEIKPEIVEIEAGGKTHKIEFYPSDLRTRRAFFEVYEKLKAYKTEVRAPETDENGISNLKLLETRELEKYTDFLAECVDNVFGAGTADILMSGRCNPTELIRFIASTAHFFREATEKLVREYTADAEGGAME